MSSIGTRSTVRGDGDSLAASPRDRLGIALALLALSQFIIALDLNIVFVALPEIGEGLGFSDQTRQWVVSAYAVFSGGFLLLGGRAADVFGRRRMFLTGLGLYGVASFAGGLATSPVAIVIARSVQGLGGAVLFPATLSLINTLFAHGPARNRALAVWGGAGASGLCAGALLGGVLTESLGWRWVFFVNVPLALAVAAAGIFVIPRDPTRSGRRRFDLPGALTATAGSTLLVYALVQAPESGWTAPSIIGAFVLAAIGLAAFVAIEAKGHDPLMPLHLVGNRQLVTGMATTFVFMGTFGAMPYFFTVLFQSVYGYSALRTGFAFLVPALATAFGTQVGERMTTRFGSRPTVLGGFAVGVGGTLALATVFDVGAGYLAALPWLIVWGVGQGIAWTAMWVLAGEGVVGDEQGIASGMASMTQNLGNAVGLALLIAVANATVAGPGESVADAVADGSRRAVVLIAVAIAIGAVAVAGVRPSRRLS